MNIEVYNKYMMFMYINGKIMNTDMKMYKDKC